MAESENRLPQQPPQAHKGWAITLSLWCYVSFYRGGEIDSYLGGAAQLPYLLLIMVVSWRSSDTMNVVAQSWRGKPMDLQPYQGKMIRFAAMGRIYNTGLKVASVFILMEDLSLLRDALFLGIDSSTHNLDNVVHQNIKFQSILITSSSQFFGHQKGACPWSTDNHFNSQYLKHWASHALNLQILPIGISTKLDSAPSHKLSSSFSYSIPAFVQSTNPLSEDDLLSTKQMKNKSQYMSMDSMKLLRNYVVSTDKLPVLLCIPKVTVSP
ncbi:hypothetical protein Tco_0064101 [Tanacetum coccineum]